MESISYLKERLSSLFASFPKLEIRYEYRESIRLHIIEVNPKSSYENDQTYIDSEIELDEQFNSAFPNEEILFITEGSLTTIYSPILELRKDFINYSVTLSLPNFFSASENETIFDDCEDYSLAA